MLSYRHAFHAGNHADVLKHALLTILLRHFAQKKSPFCYVDTHSGAGMYRLDGEWANKTAEAQSGIVKLLDYSRKNPLVIPAALSDYVRNEDFAAAGFHYAGSPSLARLLCREQDSLILSELHPAEIALLKANMQDDNRVHIHLRNGFELLASLALPARSCVLIDPSYETADDYTNVLAAVQKAYKRSSSAVFAVWYPLVNRHSQETHQLLDNLGALGAAEKVVRAELFFSAKRDAAFGLYGSGMMIINAPWKCGEQTSEVLDYVCRALTMTMEVQNGATQ